MFHSVTSRCLRRAATLCVALLVVALAADIAAACPSCVQALGASKNDSGGGDIIGGYMWSIIFMMSMPFTLLGGFGLYFYLKIRQAAKAATAARRPVDVPSPTLSLQE